MNKSEMISYLNSMFSDWEEVYYFYGYKRLHLIPIKGWWLGFDGNSFEDMYLTNKHPQSDESGEIITKAMFEERMNDY